MGTLGAVRFLPGQESRVSGCPPTPTDLECSRACPGTIFWIAPSPIFAGNTTEEPVVGFPTPPGAAPSDMPGSGGGGRKGPDSGDPETQETGRFSGPAGDLGLGTSSGGGPGNGLSLGIGIGRRGQAGWEGGPKNWVWTPFLFRAPWLVGPRRPRQTLRRLFSGPGGGPTLPPAPARHPRRTPVSKALPLPGARRGPPRACVQVPPWRPVPSWRPDDNPDAYGHTTGNTPEPVRFQKLSLVRPS